MATPRHPALGAELQCVGVKVFCVHEPQPAGHDPSFSYNIWCAKFYLRHTGYLSPKIPGELDVNYPMSEREAKIIVSREIAREVIAGKRNPWAAANHLEIAVWDWVPETAELELIFSINDEVDWNSNEKRTLHELRAALTKAFVQLASLTITT